MGSAPRWLQGWRSLRHMKKSTEILPALIQESEMTRTENIRQCNARMRGWASRRGGTSLKPGELKRRQLPWPLSDHCLRQRTLLHHSRPKNTVCRVFSFSHCPQELPSIVARPRPVLSSSHCFCVKGLVSPLGRGAGMPGWKAPGDNAFWTPSCPPWFDAVHLSLVGRLCPALQEVHYFRPLQRQSLNPPSLLSLKSLHPLNAAILSSRVEYQSVS